MIKLVQYALSEFFHCAEKLALGETMQRCFVANKTLVSVKFIGWEKGLKIVEEFEPGLHRVYNAKYYKDAVGELEATRTGLYISEIYRVGEEIGVNPDILHVSLALEVL
jgi:hypothetical protein